VRRLATSPWAALPVASTLAFVGLLAMLAIASGPQPAGPPRTRSSGTAPTALALTSAATVPAAAAVMATPPPRRPHPHRKPWPVTIEMRTVPALPGVRMTFDGGEYATGPDGSLKVTGEHDFHQHTLKLVDTTINSATRHYQFVRWIGQRDPDQAYRPSVTGLPRRADYTVTAVFRVLYPFMPVVVDTAGAPVPMTSIDALTVRGDDGRVVRVKPGARTWLVGEVPSYRSGEVHVRRVGYSVQSIVVDGANTVDEGQQAFHPADAHAAPFVAKFFDLHVSARDALFHRRLPGTVRVTMPNGELLETPLGHDGTAVLPHLPRGAYTVDVAGSGTGVPTRVVLSRTSRTEVVVATTTDKATLGAGALAFAGGLLLLGRGRALHRRLLRVVVPPGRAVLSPSWSGGPHLPLLRPASPRAYRLLGRPRSVTPRRVLRQPGLRRVLRQAVLALPLEPPTWVAAHTVNGSSWIEESSRGAERACAAVAS
jgi:hypothetical protein